MVQAVSEGQRFRQSGAGQRAAGGRQRQGKARQPGGKAARQLETCLCALGVQGVGREAGQLPGEAEVLQRAAVNEQGALAPRLGVRVERGVQALQGGACGLKKSGARGERR